MRFPWETEQLPAPVETAPLPAELGDTVAAMQRDMAYMVAYTAVRVHSSRPELAVTVNTLRGQIVPMNQCRFTDGTVFELQDIGMPQPNTPTMTVRDLLVQIWEVTRELGLELQP